MVHSDLKSAGADGAAAHLHEATQEWREIDRADEEADQDECQEAQEGTWTSDGVLHAAPASARNS